MDPNALYYAFSTIAQCAAALAALIGFLGMWRLDRLREEHNEVEQRVVDLAKETMPHYDSADPLYNPSWWLQRAQRVAETPSGYEEQKSKLGSLLPRLKALPGAQRQLLWTLRIFLFVTLATLGAAVVGFLYVDQAKAWVWTPWLLWIAGGWLAVGPIIVVLAAARLPRAPVEDVGKDTPPKGFEMAPDIQKEHAIETYKSLIQISVEMLKLLALLNGGAAVALLAYLGNVAGKGGAVPDMRIPMLSYLVGLVLCGATFFLSYLTQLGLYGESMAFPPSGPPHTVLLRVAFCLGVLSLVAFAVGSGFAAFRFQ